VKKQLWVLLMLLISFYPNQVFSEIILYDVYNFRSVGVHNLIDPANTLTYDYFDRGEWYQSININDEYGYSHASQSSNIEYDSENDILRITGSGGTYNQGFSTIGVRFKIDEGQYNYVLDVDGPISGVSSDFDYIAGSGAISARADPYSMGFTFTSALSSDQEIGYFLNFEVTPVTAVPLPGALLLLGAGLLRLAHYRRRNSASKVD
jgi:hypothetical protein